LQWVSIMAAKPSTLAGAFSAPKCAKTDGRRASWPGRCTDRKEGTAPPVITAYGTQRNRRRGRPNNMCGRRQSRVGTGAHPRLPYTGPVATSGLSSAFRPGHMQSGLPRTSSRRRSENSPSRQSLQALRLIAALI
jgi:hypothetical protein